ncbi:MAG TPA: hypothetical protein VFU56_03270 [Gaiellaceae bacterium]|nr:hypothetical protein [Gaiellaceae bacterium]
MDGGLPGALGSPLEREHRQIDAALEEFASVGGTEPLSRAIAALRRHIYLDSPADPADGHRPRAALGAFLEEARLATAAHGAGS